MILRHVYTGLAATVLAALAFAGPVPAASSAGHLQETFVSPPPYAAEVTSPIEFLAFASPITVARGGTVTWVNRDVAPHNVVAADASFQSQPLMQLGEAFSHTFAESGSYGYVCRVHPDMTGVVVVE
jgi:plastocyanin